ncbi:MAG: hypothetical protein NZM00_09580, partial [Anaerolinea sp.]|nr:hypothetical protein [Anaerolinea sp.]
ATAFFPFERVILFDFTPEQGIMLRPAGADRPDYNPQGRIDAGASPPARVFTALIDYPAPRPGSWLTFFDLR